MQNVDYTEEERLDGYESDAPSVHSNHPTDSEQSAGHSSEEDEDIQSDGLSFIGKDKVTIWAKHPPRSNVRRGRENTVVNRPGVKTVARSAKTIVDSWKLFFPDDMILHITNCTNMYLQKMRQNYARERDCPDTTPQEIMALLGLLYMAGVKKSAHLNIHELWADDVTSPACFRAVMSSRRFYTLLEALRFDNLNDRNQRKTTDNLAPIREVFDEFVTKCLNNYQVGEYTTIDEMLPAFRGRCKFRQYISNKPSKYGIKIYALVDSTCFYVSNLEIYPGKQPEGPFSFDNKAESVVKRLADHILNTGRNITTDNYFTSIPLALNLLEKRTTVVGTIRKNKKEIPPIIVQTKDRRPCSSMFAFLRKGVLVSYVPKKNKNVLLFSTLHSGDKIDESTFDKCKPEIVTFYNATKGGVDVVDELISQYTVSRNSCRWPLTVFYCLLNIAGINSQIIYTANTENKIERRIFLRELALELMKPQAETRLSIPNLPLKLRDSIKQLVGVEEKIPEARVRVTGMCSLCPRRKNRKTKKTCCKCSAYLCNEHCRSICQRCL